MKWVIFGVVAVGFIVLITVEVVSIVKEVKKRKALIKKQQEEEEKENSINE